MSDFTQLVDLAAERLGGVALAANDEFFAPKENLLKAAKPVFIEDKYTDRGKWMDGWETRRRRTPGHDWCIVRLGVPGILRGVVVDTSHFKGNFPESCSLEACAAPATARADELAAPGVRWVEVLPRTPLKGDAQNRFALHTPWRFTHVRLNIYPDGGVARLRVHGEALPDWRQILAPGTDVDLAAIIHGGRIVAASDMFFSAPQNLLLPGRGANMGDGWETKRRRGPGHDWVVVRLGITGSVSRVEVDTAHFKGNFPDSCSLEACDAARAETLPPEKWPWKPVLPRTPLVADRLHVFDSGLGDAGAVTHVRFNIFPDGGVSRLHIFGRPSRDGRVAEGLRWLNALVEEQARAALLDCCGSARWAHLLAEARPFAGLEPLLAAATRIWNGLDRGDWLEAFSRHPRIGERAGSAQQSAAASRWSEQEQSAVAGAGEDVRAALAEANRAYEARFGYIFIVCATGKSATEMLTLVRQRMENDPEAELRTAAEEQRKITALRLEKLLEL